MENKFRAWDNKEKRWITSLFCFVMKGKDVGKAVNEGKEPCYLEICCGLKVELNQFTGIKDKNGKEIYEGDIVKTFCGIGEVINENGDWVVVPPCESLGSFLNIGGLVEILGNIYENKELKKYVDKPEYLKRRVKQ